MPSGLAFDDSALADALNIGVLTGSVLSAVLGYLVFLLAARAKLQLRPKSEMHSSKPLELRYRGGSKSYTLLQLRRSEAMADQSKGELAHERTDFAEDRTVLANERTFAGWLRTGYAGIGIGLAFNALFGRVQPGWTAKLIATGFLLIAIMIFIFAERRSCALFSRLQTHKVQSVKLTNIRILSYASIAVTIALIAAIWLLTFKPPAA